MSQMSVSCVKLSLGCVATVGVSEKIVIGGGVSAAFDLFAAQARDEMIARAFPVSAQRCQIVKAECGDDAGLLGAAWLAFGVR